MGNSYRGDNQHINGLSILHLILRPLLLVTLYYLYSIGGYDRYEFSVLIMLLSPVTLIYLVSFIRFAIRFPYTISVERISIRLSNLHFALHLFTYSVVGYIIIRNPWDKEGLTLDNTQWVILLCECIQAVWVSIHLARLFEVRDF